MGHAEVVAMARKNQRAQKRPRPTFKQPSRQNQVQPKSPGTTKRPQWSKNAKARLTKPSTSSVFEQKRPHYSNRKKMQQTKKNSDTPVPRTTKATRASTKTSSNFHQR